MAKQPKLVLREHCVWDMTKRWSPGRFVEMGAGTGGMTRLFLERGFKGACHDLAKDSRSQMRTNLRDHAASIEIVECFEDLSESSFEYMLAFEVLEHIPDDLGVLTQWSRYLKSGGRLIVSVPAHQRKFGRSDELVGHVRRYEKQQLHDLLVAAGYCNIRIVNYGFPITELTRRFSNFLVRHDHSYDGLSAEQRSIRSAQIKPRVINRWLGVFSGSLVKPFCYLQRLFYDLDLGDGLVASADKR